MSLPLLSADKLCYQVNNHRLLHEVSLTLQAGELVGVIGPNGAGKTTLLKTLLGYLSATQGQVWVQGAPLESLGSVARAERLSYLSQESADGFPFVVRDVVGLGAYAAQTLGRYSQAHLSHQISIVLDQLGIGHLADRIFTQLSGGEKQLVQFARLLIQDASVMLLDEPTANLDLGHEYDLMHALRQQCELGKAVLVTLHNLNTAAEFCDRVILISDGCLVSDGSPEAVITQDMIQQLYTEHALVVMNNHTGSINVLPKARIAEQRGIHVHVIGGAGSGIRVSKLLSKAGCRVTGGVGHQDDSDLAYWEATGIDYVETPNFNHITDSAFEQAAAWVSQADVTVLCDFPMGAANAKNLALAALSQQLIVMASHSAQQRFFDDQLQAQFDALVARSQVLDLDALLPAVLASKDRQ